MESLITIEIMVLICMWWIAYLAHIDIRHLEILIKQIDETIDKKL